MAWRWREPDAAALACGFGGRCRRESHDHGCPGGKIVKSSTAWWYLRGLSYVKSVENNSKQVKAIFENCLKRRYVRAADGIAARAKPEEGVSRTAAKS